MGFTKWIGATLGWSFGGPIGAIIGLALGSMVDSLSSGNSGSFSNQGQPQQGRRTTYTTRTQQRPQTQPGDFEVSLLILASIVIKADGKQDQRELDFVRQQFVNMYGKERANQSFTLFKH